MQIATVWSASEYLLEPTGYIATEFVPAIKEQGNVKNDLIKESRLKRYYLCSYYSSTQDQL